MLVVSASIMGVFVGYLVYYDIFKLYLVSNFDNSLIKKCESALGEILEKNRKYPRDKNKHNNKYSIKLIFTPNKSVFYIHFLISYISNV